LFEGDKSKMQQAAGGTLFLEEVHALSIPLQARLLRMITESEQNASEENKDVRFLFTSNRNLTELVRTGHFREDLYYRIQSVYLTIPPLRERMEDFSLLTRHFLKIIEQNEGRRGLKLDPKTLRSLVQYGWPGNVRELYNTLRAMVYMTEGVRLSTASIPIHIFHTSKTVTTQTGKLEDILAKTELQVLENTLATYPDKTEAAAVLGISRSTLYEKLKKYNL